MSVIYLSTFYILFYKKNLIFSNKNGITFVYLSNIVRNMQFILFKTSVIIKYKFKNNKIIDLRDFLINKINCVFYDLFYLKNIKLFLSGIGFRLWHFLYKNNQNIALKIGFSKDLCIKIPKAVSVVFLKPTLIFFKCLNNTILTQFASFLCSLKKRDIYKGKGFFYSNSKIILKIGKRN